MQKSVLHIIGTRPNIPKFQPVWDALEKLSVNQAWVHTGQHNSETLFGSTSKALGLVSPIANLELSGLATSEFMSKAITGIVQLVGKLNPKIVIVYGDVNSTLAGAFAASICGVHLVHVESGLRSHESDLPEERIRKLVDAISDTLITSLPSAYANLMKEGKDPGSVFQCGNTMIDSLVSHLNSPQNLAKDNEFDLEKDYALLTLHRGSNVDNLPRLKQIMDQVDHLAKKIDILFPVHPRTLKNLPLYKSITICEPLNYNSFVRAMQDAQFVLTDSGGIQEESTYLGVPCYTLRVSTERPETITLGTNLLVNLDDIPGLSSRDHKVSTMKIPLWDGHAGTRVASTIAKLLSEL
jgi:UDP-N-acetylglucosamine 2-epimerase (non-hydrolysing)